MAPQLRKSMGERSWRGMQIPPAHRLLFLCILTIAMLSRRATGLQYVPGSKCESVCSNSTAGTLLDDVVCLDNEFNTAPGSYLKECVACELNSTAVDHTTNITDVQWALFNIRYALSNCMFAWPVERVSISSPCQVTCAPLHQAISSGISNSSDLSSNLAEFNYCNAGQFDDTTINNCAFCYSFIPEQLFLGNFLQALHIACHSPPIVGNTFYPDGRTIFNESTIAGPVTQQASAAASSGLTGWKLALAIALPIVGGILILLATCFCCWHFTSKRRQRMAESGRMSRFHDHKNTMSGGLYSQVTPKMSQTERGWSEPPREMESIVVAPKSFDTPSKRSPGLAQGRWSQHGNDEAGTPLNSATRANFSSEEIEPPRMYNNEGPSEQFIGIATSSDAAGTSHAYDNHI